MNGTADCGAFLERFQHEHHELNRALIEIRNELVRLDAGHDNDVVLRHVSQRLNTLASDLGRHFAEEEECGCVAEVLARCPSLAPQVRAMQIEHPALLAAVNALAASVAGQIAAHEKLPQDFEAFARRLKSHQATENRLLQMALGGDAAEYDAEGNE
jgi:hemerythrin